MAHNIMINRDEAHLLVDLLEENYRTGKLDPAGAGADLALEIRDLFGMNAPPDMEYKESDNE